MPQRLPSEPEAIFIVGIARSGTTMMRHILETSSRIGIARETHFVGHLFARRGVRALFRDAGDLADDGTIRRIVEMLYSGEFQRRRQASTYWGWLVETVPRKELETRLLAAERTERGMMGALMRVHSDVLGRPVMGEKTPAHLAYVDTLLKWFPGGRVIHMIRDPRAVFVSDVNRRRTRPRPLTTFLMRVPHLLEAVLLLEVTFLWRAAARRHSRFQERYPGRYKLVRFEDVVQRPSETLPALFDFLGVALPADATGIELSAGHGMREQDKGLDPDAADRWRGRIHPFAARWLLLFCGNAMRQLGYDVEKRPRSVVPA